MKKALVIAGIISIMGIFSELKPCIITYIHDGRGSVQLCNLNDKSNKNRTLPQTMSVPLKSKEQRRFGDAHDLGHFAVYVKNPKNKSMYLAFEIKQNECSKNGNPVIRTSDLKNRTGETHLFDITENKYPHESMVSSLPILQKPDIYNRENGTECSNCNH